MKHKSMVRQVQETLQAQLRIGESRHQAKNEENTHAPAGIFSYRTFETHLKQSCAFAKWAKAEYGSRTLPEQLCFSNEVKQATYRQSRRQGDCGGTQRTAGCE